MNILRILRLSDCVSIINALLGFCAIVAAFSGNKNFSFLLIILAGMADGLDGYLARRTSAGQLGPDLDSLADMISFGIAPAVLAVAVFGPSGIMLAASMIYISCGILRLARFNLSAKDDGHFEGLPITASGMAAAASILLGWPWLTSLLMLVMSALMVSSIPYDKIRDFRALAGFALLLLGAAGIILYHEEAVFSGLLVLSLMTAYMASPLVMSCLRIKR